MFLCILIRDFPVIVFTAAVLIRIVKARLVWTEFRDVYVLPGCQSSSSAEPINWSSSVRNGPALTVRYALRLQTRRPCQSLGDMRHTPKRCPTVKDVCWSVFMLASAHLNVLKCVGPSSGFFINMACHVFFHFFLNKVENTFNFKSPPPCWLSNPGTTVKWHRDICDLPLIPVTDLPAGWKWALARPCQTTKSTQGEYLWIKM